ncbi:MAG: transcription-repair coupling factor [Bacteriovoracaceae bacterium]|nr:transcription-repair coupling factor [Bacteriovoracaceae bacterium]
MSTFTPAEIPDQKRDLFQINGLSASSFLYFISKHFRSGLIVLPSSQDLDSAKETLSYFLNSEISVLTYPPFERTYEPIRQEPKTTLDRIRTQNFLSNSKKPSFILTTLESLSQKTISKKELLAATLSVEKGAWLERDPFIVKLLELGYRQDDLAEDHGFFSVRGHLLDIFSPYEDHPFRVEFFGDEVVSIRTFDPETQRSLNDLVSISILPCRELILKSSDWPRAREQIKNFADEKGIDREERDRVLSDLENHRDLLESRWLLPPFSSLASIEDYLPKDLPLIFVNQELALEEYEASIDSEDRAFKNLNRLAYGPEVLRAPIDRWISTPHHELITTVAAKGQNYQVLSFEELRSRIARLKSFSPLLDEIESLRGKGLDIELLFQNEKREMALRESVELPAYVQWGRGPLFDGFSSSTFKKAIITEKDIFGVRRRRSAASSQSTEDFLRQFSDLKNGDFVIHEDHGVGRFRGLQTLELHQAKSEFLVIEYADSDKLYLPIYRVDKLSRYVGEGVANPRLDKLGSTAFSKRKSKIKKDILRIAHELLEIAAARKLNKVDRPEKVDMKIYRKFCDLFPFETTPDQEAAVVAIEKDLQQAWPMDRLVCGDVGFGKTEVALRAAMLSVLQGKQVAILAPTTILVEQHFRTFKKRFADFPFRVEHLSRFVSTADQKKAVASLAEGGVHLVIGTHRLLQSDIKFKNLGLLVIDEEQRFGVKHKERIKKFRATTDVLTLSATPIPRTLQMSILGIRDLSLISTPPESREAVKTFIGAFDDTLIRNAAMKEIQRGGQILFVHNRVQSIDSVAQKLKKILPEIKIVTAHGQMKEGELEQKMLQYLEQKADLLLATTIIEHGLDIPSANTLFVDHAEMFGLSDLYQLRGRVGRSHIAASAYFLIHEHTNLTPEASKRLQVIQSCTELGSGFHVATHDMEIRGSGNILGEEQSGVMAEVGLELYTQMLQETLSELKHTEPIEPLPELSAGYTSYIPEFYIPDASVRIWTYKNLNRVRTPRELLELENELLDRFGLYPREVENLCQLTRLRVIAHALKATTLDIFPGRLGLVLSPSTPLDPKKIIPLLGKNLSLDPKGRLVFTFASSLKDPKKVENEKHPELLDFSTCRNFLKQLCETAGVSLENV